jgi:hypothetical protein
VLPSLNVPMAENCWLVVAAIVASPGMMASEARLAALTVTADVPLTEPEAAVIVVVPRFRAVASPLAVIDATPVFEELHVAVPVMSCVDPSEKVPIAVNCCKVPREIERFAGVTAIEVTVAPVTVSVALEEMPTDVAVMAELPAAIAMARPGTPLALMLAAAEFPDVHCAELVMFCVLPSENVPVAMNCVVVPGAIDAVNGEIEIARNAALVTVTVALEEMPPEVAVTVAEPTPVAIASPKVPFALIATSDELPDVHCTDAVRFCVLPSVKVPVAASCTLVPSASAALAGDTASEASAAALTVKVELPLMLE